MHLSIVQAAKAVVEVEPIWRLTHYEVYPGAFSVVIHQTFNGSPVHGTEIEVFHTESDIGQVNEVVTRWLAKPRRRANPARLTAVLSRLNKAV